MEFDAKQIEDKFKKHLQYVDETVQIVLKGHLLIEEVLDSILKTFVFHSQFVDAASLRFAQKVNLARALSLDEHENDLWNLAISLNTLRNELAHSLHDDKRARKIATLRETYYRLVGDSPAELRDPNLPDQMVIYWSVALVLGFLDAFQSEATRFRAWVDDLDKVVNPHRHVGMNPV
jgi:hypothetical protein